MKPDRLARAAGLKSAGFNQSAKKAVSDEASRIAANWHLRPAVSGLSQGRVIRLAGGLVCPNCNQMLRACDVIVDNLDLTLLCWELSRRYLVGRERSGFRRVIKSQNFKGLIDQTMENQNV